MSREGLDPNARQAKIKLGNNLRSDHLCSTTCPRAGGKGLAQSGHRDSYSPRGRSSGRVTFVMLGRNLGATLAAAVGTQSPGM